MRTVPELPQILKSVGLKSVMGAIKAHQVQPAAKSSQSKVGRIPSRRPGTFNAPRRVSKEPKAPTALNQPPAQRQTKRKRDLHPSGRRGNGPLHAAQSRPLHSGLINRQGARDGQTDSSNKKVDLPPTETHSVVLCKSPATDANIAGDDAVAMNLLCDTSQLRTFCFPYNTASEILRRMIAEGADAKLIDVSWISNHCRWIIWKLASYQCRQRHLLENLPVAPCRFHPECLLEQLRHRYDREKVRVQRSALRTVLDGDATISHPVVLFVASLGNTVEQTIGKTGVQMNRQIELSDGWWPISGILDRQLTQHARLGKIKIGDKLFCVGLQKVGGSTRNSEEDPAQTTVLLHVNGVRMARADAKLGWHRLAPHAFSLPIRSLWVDGGPVAVMDLVVQRLGPELYREAREDGRRVFRDSAAEGLAAKRFEQIAERKRQHIIDELHREKKLTSNETSKMSMKSLPGLDDNDFYAAVNASGDPHFTLSELSRDQQRRYSDLNDERAYEDQRRIEKRLAKECAPRDSGMTFRVLVTDARAEDSSSTDQILSGCDSCTLQVWNGSEDLRHIFAEGNHVRVHNVVATKLDFGNRVFNFSRSSRVEKVEVPTRCPAFVPRRVNPLATVGACKAGSRVDLVGLLLRPKASDQGQNASAKCLYFTDPSGVIVAFHSHNFDDGETIDARMQRYERDARQECLPRVVVRDAIYRGRSQELGLITVYATEETVLGLHFEPVAVGRMGMPVTNVQGQPDPAREAQLRLGSWAAGEGQIDRIRLLESQIAECLGGADPNTAPRPRLHSAPPPIELTGYIELAGTRPMERDSAEEDSVLFRTDIVGMQHHAGLTNTVARDGLVLRREPGNAVDADAVAVYNRGQPEVQIGHLHRKLAANLAPLMDSSCPPRLEAKLEVRDPTTWTMFQQDGPNHLGLW